MKKKIQNVAFHNLGCKVNSYELDVVQQKFEEKGYCIVPFDDNADIYIVNTCTVTNIADRKSRQMLHQAKKRNPDALVVALGCYVQTDSEQVRLDPCIDLAIGNNRKKDTVEIVEDYLAKKEQGSYDADAGNKVPTPEAAGCQDKPTQHRAVIDIGHTNEYEEMQLKKTGEHTRAYIKIQDGCNQFCTYCIIPFARGRVRSRQPEDIRSEIKGLVRAGYREFVLTGIHISSYGVDFEPDHFKETELSAETDKETVAYGKGISRLEELIDFVHGIDGVERIRLGSLEPRVVTEGFARHLSGLPKICPHFHLSLQSGCDETLRRMNRHYTTEEYRRGVEYLRKYFDTPAITTDVIAGFPGETEEEFQQTVEFLSDIHFFEMHIFPYSLRKNTVAATMSGQIDGSVKKKRAHELLLLEQKQSLAYRQSFIGKEETVLLEEQKEINGNRYMIGHTTRYVKVAKRMDDKMAEKELSGQIVTGRLKGMLTDEILELEDC